MVTRRHAPDAARHAAGGGRLLKRGLAGATATALVVTGLALVNTAANAAEPISGKVFLDYSGDGSYTTAGGVRDTLLGGVTVTAYNEAGDEIGSTVTTVNESAGSNYTLQVDAAIGEPVRVEFTDLPAGMHDTFSASNSGVQFTTVGSASVDYGIFDANQYSPIAVGDSANPTIGAVIMVAGSRTDANVSDEPVIVGNKWNVTQNVTGRDGRYSLTGGSDNQAVPAAHGSYTIGNTASADAWRQRTTWANYSEVGSVFSLTADAKTRSIYAAAAYKRLSDLGPEGLGGVYVVEGAVDLNGDPKTRDGLRSFNVEDLGIDVGSSEIADQAGRGLGSPNKLLNDIDPFELAGKVGIGGIVVDTDTRILYLVNLFDKKVYAIDISDAASPQLIGSVDTLASANQRAFALTLHQGQLYVGYNDTGASPFQAASSAGLKYFVDRVPALEPGEAAFGAWEHVLQNGDLGYAKGDPTSGWGGNPSSSSPQITRWNTWTDVWSQGGSSVGRGSDWGNIHVYPQPLLSGIAFDRQGFMTLGFMDRSQLQGGNQNCQAAGACTSNSALWQTLASGDILIAAPTRSSDNSAYASWTPESNGRVSGDTGTRQTTAGGANEGPGGREFFEDRQWYSQASAGNHREIALGGVVVVPGTADQVASNAYDPLEPVRAVGVQWFDLQNGSRARGYQHTWDPGDPLFNATRTSFQKGGGMGGLALLAKAAPVEIGNRTWLDLNENGVQDADEPAISGATVELYRAENGEPVGDRIGAAKQTDANGHYFFRTGEVGYEEFTPEGEYVVVFTPGNGDVQLAWPAGQPSGFSAPNWANLVFTVPGAGAADDPQSPERDSNAVPAGDAERPSARGNAPVSVGHAGQNDHSIDAGWTIGTVTVGDRVWIDENRNGTQDHDGEAYTEPGVEGVLLKIYRAPAGGGAAVEVTRDAYGAPLGDENGEVRTNGEGLYLFEKLPVLAAGEVYEVRIVRDDERTLEALSGYEPTATGQGDRDEDSSEWIAETSTETTLGLFAPGAEDRTLDFGFVKLEPSAIILKGDGSDPDNVQPADTAETAVDLTVSGADEGTTSLLFQVTNNGSEPLHDLVVTDTSAGSGTLTDLVCVFPGEQSPTAGEKQGETWTVAWANSFEAAGDDRAALPVGASFECTATLEGVVGDHRNVAEIEATGAETGEPIAQQPFDPEHPDEPGTENPFHAKRTPSVSVGDRVWFDSDGDGEQARTESGGYDPSEPGIDGVVLEILDRAETRQSTSSASPCPIRPPRAAASTPSPTCR